MPFGLPARTIYPSLYLRFSAQSGTSAGQIIGTSTDKRLTMMEATVTLTSAFTVAVSASMGDEDFSVIAAGYAQCLSDTDGRFEGCLASAEQIPPASSKLATTTDSISTTPVSDALFAASTSASSSSAVKHHQILSLGQMVLRVVWPVVAVASTTAFTLGVQRQNSLK